MRLPPQLSTFLNAPSPRGDRTVEYLAELIVLNNGNTEVTEFGKITEADNKLGRVGLMVEEAFHLNQLINFMKGILWTLGQPELEEAVTRYIKREVDKTTNGSSLYLPTTNEVGKYGR